MNNLRCVDVAAEATQIVHVGVEAVEMLVKFPNPHGERVPLAGVSHFDVRVVAGGRLWWHGDVADGLGWIPGKPFITPRARQRTDSCLLATAGTEHSVLQTKTNKKGKELATTGCKKNMRIKKTSSAESHVALFIVSTSCNARQRRWSFMAWKNLPNKHSIQPINNTVALTSVNGGLRSWLHPEPMVMVAKIDNWVSKQARADTMTRTADCVCGPDERSMPASNGDCAASVGGAKRLSPPLST